MVKMRAHIIVLLAVLVLVGVIVSPVSGYTLMNDVTISGGTTNLYFNPAALLYKNITASYETTRIEWSGNVLMCPGGRYDGTWSGPIKEGSTVRGNYTITWDGEAWVNWTYYAPTTAIIEITDITSGMTGKKEFNNADMVTYMQNSCGYNINVKGVTDNNDFTAQPDNFVGFVSDHASHDPGNGQYLQYSGTSVSPPVANFACDNVFSNPMADITCTDLSTNNPDSWEFHSYYPNYSAYEVHTVDYTDSPWTLTLEDIGYYDVHLKVTNSAGSDWENKSEYIRIMLFPCWTATPTPAITAVPWTNLTTFNMTAYRGNITSSTIGNITAPFLDVIDGLYSVIEPAFIAVERILSWPFLMINAQFEQINSIYSATWATLISYTVIPLSITGRVISAIPWEIQAIITMGIIFDIILLLIRGE